MQVDRRLLEVTIVPTASGWFEDRRQLPADGWQSSGVRHRRTTHDLPSTKICYPCHPFRHPVDQGRLPQQRFRNPHAIQNSRLPGYLPSCGSRSSGDSENRLSSSSILYFGNSNHFRVTGRNAQNMSMPQAIAVMTPTIALIIGLAPPCPRCRTCFGHTSLTSAGRHRSGGSSMRAWKNQESLAQSRSKLSLPKADAHGS